MFPKSCPSYLHQHIHPQVSCILPKLQLEQLELWVSCLLSLMHSCTDTAAAPVHMSLALVFPALLLVLTFSAGG